MDSIGGTLNPIGKWLKHTSKINFVMFYWEKLMVYNGILMETIGISSSIVFLSRIVLKN